VVTPDGRYAGSPDGIRLMHYAKDSKSIPIDTSSDLFHTPGLVAQLLRREKDNVDDSHNLYFLGSKTTKNLVFMRLYRKYERLKSASNPFIINTWPYVQNLR